MPRSKITDEQRVRVEAWTIDGVPPAEQARRLGVSVARIAATRKRVLRAGAGPHTPRPPWRSWSAKETDTLIQLVEQGMSYAQIAKKLKRTETSITIRCKRIGVRITTTNATLSASGVAAQLGIRCSKSVSGWIKRGWLNARNAGRENRPLWRISWEALTAFLENPAYWIAWQPARIPDLALREWAQELRANEERLLAHTEIALRYNVGRDTVGQWINKGWLPATRYGTRFVPESALDGWIVPIDRKTPMHADWPTGARVLIRRVPGATFYRVSP